MKEGWSREGKLSEKERVGDGGGERKGGRQRKRNVGGGGIGGGVRQLGREKERVGWKEKEGGSKIDSSV